MKSEIIDVAWATPSVYGSLQGLLSEFPQFIGETAESFTRDIAAMFGVEPTPDRSIHLVLFAQPTDRDTLSGAGDTGGRHGFKAGGATAAGRDTVRAGDVFA
jgi:hypothetical protein